MNTFNCTTCAKEGYCPLPLSISYCDNEDTCGYYNIGLYIEHQRIAFRDDWFEYNDGFYN